MGDGKENQGSGYEMPCKLYWELGLDSGSDEKLLKN